MAPASTVLIQSTVAEGDDLFPALLSHLRKQYPEVYVLGVDTSRAPKRMELLIGEGGGLSGGSSSVNSSIKLGAYAGRLAYLHLAGINKPSPNLTTVYLDTPLVGPTTNPLEYVPLPGPIGQPSGYPPNSAGGDPCTGGSKRSPPLPPPLYSTYPRMNTPTGRAQPRRVMQATVPEQNFKFLTPGREPLAKFWPQGLERPNPPTHAYKHRGGGQGSYWGPGQNSNGPRNLTIWQLGGNPWRNFGRRYRKGLTPPRTPTGTGGAAGRRLGPHQRGQWALKNFKIW